MEKIKYKAWKTQIKIENAYFGILPTSPNPSTQWIVLDLHLKRLLKQQDHLTKSPRCAGYLQIDSFFQISFSFTPTNETFTYPLWGFQKKVELSKNDLFWV